MSRVKVSICIVAFAALYLAGCIADAPQDPDQVGMLELPLTSVGSSGTRFALAGTFSLVGPETLSTVVSATDATFATADMVTMNPRVGAYNLTLSQWTLHRVNVVSGVITGTTPTTGAVLLNTATQAVNIQNMQTATVVYQFSVPGSGTVMFARGTLNIDFSVGEGFPDGTACTQGADCTSKVCSGAPQVCAAPTCSDGVQNGTETSPDCGGSCTCNTPGGAGAACNPSNPIGCAPGLLCVIQAGAGICM